MSGLLDLVGLGGYAGAGSGGLLDSLRGQSGMLTSLGAGLLSGNNWQSGLASGIQNAQRGKLLDSLEGEKKQRQNATQQWLLKQGNLSDEQRAYLSSNPDAAAEIFAASMKPKAPISVSQGETLLDPNTMKPMYTAPTKPSDRGPKTETFFNPATGQNEVRQWDQGANAWNPIGLATRPAIQQKPLTEGQSNAQGFAERMENANKAIEQYGATEGTSRMNQAADAVPFGLGTGMKSAGAQQYDQAQRSFVNAVLRKESGAAISEGEFENAKKQYFPQPGEGPEVIAAKAQERKIAIENMKRAGSNAPGSQASAPKSTAVTTPDGYTIEPAD